jgi:hypothetical protein
MERDPARPEVRARLLGKRAVLVTLLVVATTFIGSSALQIIPSVFGEDEQGGAGAAVAPACSEGLQALEEALDRAVSEAYHRDPDGALGRFRASLLPEWNNVGKIEQVCSKSARGLDAIAALARLRRAEERLAGRRDAEVAPLRRDVAAYLPR